MRCVALLLSIHVGWDRWMNVIETHPQFGLPKFKKSYRETDVICHSYPKKKRI